MAKIDATKIDGLRKTFSGKLIQPGDGEYDEARTIWNAMIDKHPALIARCAGTQDVAKALNFVRDNGIRFSVRGAGHHIAGNSLCDDGVVIDLSQMRAVKVDTAAKRATAEGGATLGDFDGATLAHGLATPVGINSTTGIAGLTLGGGFGWLSRKYGMTIDNLESAEVVTAKGEVLRTSASENPDLFWAIRGGGGNFGIVTRFTYRLHPVGPDLLSGLIVYPFAEAKQVLQQYREFVAKAPEELSVWTVLRKAPPLPFLPAEVHGKEVVVLALAYAGDPKKGEEVIAPLHKFGKPVGAHTGVQPFAAWQKAFDPLLTPGARNYWKTHNFHKMDDGLLDVVVKYVGTLPSPHCEIFFASIGGATKRPAPDATAYAHRDANFVMNVHGRWETAAEDEHCTRWCRDYFKASAPFASAGAYVNFMTSEETDRVRSAYGPNYERLARIKNTYDPDNLFRVNFNIQPA
ncbi:MAG TPA: FAD-binding oxidoreductase [Candidatus Saccharimonadales bacterium]|nr:FAD-binding oxidoreductase [Candidatus Saccharimonadales bacterium]